MSDRLRPLPLSTLARLLLGEARGRGTVLGVPISLLPRPTALGAASCELFGQRLATMVGPAAGPHTQLSQNIVLAYLCGGRFLELKTAQICDDIEVRKPCIDASWLGLNCEWSQELRLQETLAEYIKAELLVHLSRCELLGEALDAPLSFAFNASVGYDLEGLRSKKMRAYVSSLLRGSGPLRTRLAAELLPHWPRARDAAVLPAAVTSLTMSTMHGCPSEEIEAIAGFLLEAHGAPLLLKLNPTLLGKEVVQGLLHDELGYTDLWVPDEAFAHDPKLDEILDVVNAVRDKAARLGLGFGLKLTNTLELRRPRCALCEDEPAAYLSGRALFPLMMRAAAVLREALGPIPMAAAGGLDDLNIAVARDSGLMPLTLCTELLRPTGYLALARCVRALETTEPGTLSLSEAATKAARDSRYAAVSQRVPRRPARSLDAFDCNAAPCTLACPAGQAAPVYLRALAEGRPGDALDAVLLRNPLPSITGHVCPAPCEQACVRGHTGEALSIRELKRLAALADPSPMAVPVRVDRSVAVVGAGPAGLSAAAFLARGGVSVTLFERGPMVGGVPARFIPPFRLPTDAVSRDLAQLLAHPLVRIEAGVDPLEQGGPEALRRRGFSQVVLATGAGNGRRLRIVGEQLAGVQDGLVFLESLRLNRAAPLGESVLVVGGGSSAVDAARAAKRLVGARGRVEIVYRRSLAEMPAQAHERELAVQEGVTIRELCVPVRFEGESGRLVGLTVLRAVLEGYPGERPRPVPVPASEHTLEASAVIVAIGQSDELLSTDERCRCADPEVYAIGDARRGPATVIEAIADACLAAADILERLGSTGPAAEAVAEPQRSLARLLEHKAGSARTRPQDIVLRHAQEADRCLSCDQLCGLCVAVCPNRANLLYESAGLDICLGRLVVRGARVSEVEPRRFAVTQRYQIANLAEACNACGNCAGFCPSSGAPYLDKPRLWITKPPAGQRGAWLRLTREGYVAQSQTPQGLARLERRGDAVRFDCGAFCVKLDSGLSIVEARCRAGAREGESLDLHLAARLFVLCEGIVHSAGYLLQRRGTSPHKASSACSGVSGATTSPGGNSAPAARKASRRAKKAPSP